MKLLVNSIHTMTNLLWKSLYLKGRNFCNKKFSGKKFSQSEVPNIESFAEIFFTNWKWNTYFAEEIFANQEDKKSFWKKVVISKLRGLFYIFRSFNFEKWVKKLIRTFEIVNAVSEFCLTYNKLVTCTFLFIIENIKNISVKESSKTQESSTNFKGDNEDEWVFYGIP